MQFLYSTITPATTIAEEPLAEGGLLCGRQVDLCLAVSSAVHDLAQPLLATHTTGTAKPL